MSSPRSVNRSMFWRVERRLLFANRGRVFVILLALCAGSAVTAALLNLQVDAKRRITTDFQSFGANVVIVPASGDSNNLSTLDESVVSRIPRQASAGKVEATSILYLIADVRVDGPPAQVVVGGIAGAPLGVVMPYREVFAASSWHGGFQSTCIVGQQVASKLGVFVQGTIWLRTGNREIRAATPAIISSGGQVDGQVFCHLVGIQSLAGLPGRISTVLLRVPGSPQAVKDYIADLQRTMPDVDVRPIRQFTEAQARIYSRFSGLLSATIAVILILTSLCVMAAMTNIAMERKNDVALMKAIGGAARRVLRLFLVEATLLGTAGGLLGAALGILLSIWLGKAVFGVAARPQFVVYPVTVLLTVIVAILGAFPLRRLAGIRPAAIFRGAE